MARFHLFNVVLFASGLGISSIACNPGSSWVDGPDYGSYTPPPGLGENRMNLIEVDMSTEKLVAPANLTSEYIPVYLNVRVNSGAAYGLTFTGRGIGVLQAYATPVSGGEATAGYIGDFTNSFGGEVSNLKANLKPGDYQLNFTWTAEDAGGSYFYDLIGTGEGRTDYLISVDKDSIEPIVLDDDIELNPC